MRHPANAARRRESSPCIFFYKPIIYPEIGWSVMLKRLFYSAAFLLFTLFALVALLLFSDGSAFRGETFDKHDWVNNARCSPNDSQDCSGQKQRCPRGGMVQDLTNRYLKDGEASKSDIEDLLGPADRQLEIRSQICDAYYLGMCTAMSFDGDSLYVCFDDADRLIKSGYITH